MTRSSAPLERLLGSAGAIARSRIEGHGPEGRLPLTPEMLRSEPSGNIFGLTQNAGMGWRPDALGGRQYVAVCDGLLRDRTHHPGLAPHDRLPDDSRLWAALQRASGGTWAVCVYDVERIVAALEAGTARVQHTESTLAPGASSRVTR